MADITPYALKPSGVADSTASAPSPVLAGTAADGDPGADTATRSSVASPAEPSPATAPVANQTGNASSATQSQSIPTALSSLGSEFITHAPVNSNEDSSAPTTSEAIRLKPFEPGSGNLAMTKEGASAGATLIEGLRMTLPMPGSHWTAQARHDWFTLAKSIFTTIYKDEPVQDTKAGAAAAGQGEK